jgi:hypothetical protein
MRNFYFFGLITLMSINCMSLNRNIDKIDKEIIIQNFISNNFNNYSNIYVEIENLINIRIKNFNKTITGQLFRQYKVDNLLVFNKDTTKLYTTINTKAGINAIGSSDLIQSLYGVKIEGKWLVFLGANLIAMRDDYKYNKYEPFTWDEISYMAHEQMFGRYISISDNGKLIMKSDIVEKYVNPEHIGGSSISQEGTEKERFLRLWEFENSQTLDSTEIAQIKEDLEAGKNKPRDPIKKVTWWDRLWGKEVPIFETDEWKNFVKSKNQ